MVQLLIFILMLALGFPVLSNPIDCTGLEEADCQTLQNAALAMREAGSFNNASFTGQLGGSGGTSEGNTGTVSGSGPVILNEGLTGEADLTFTVTFNEEDSQPGQFVLKENHFYIASQNEAGETVWSGADFGAEENLLVRELLTGEMLAEAFATPGVVATVRLEDTEMNGQTMQVFMADVDLIAFLLTPRVLAALEAALASVPEEQGGGMTGSDLAGAIQLLPVLLSDDTIRYTIQVGADDGLIHHMEVYVNIVLDASLIDPNIGETTLNIDFKTDIDQAGETFTVEAPAEYEPINFDLDALAEAGLSEAGGSAEADYTVEGSIAYGETITGILSGDNNHDVYSFEATEGDVVTITVKAPSAESSFDAQAILLNANGEELAFNDDHETEREDLGVFDAVISQFTIPADGEYRIVATWLTETRDGDYELILEKE